MFARIVSVACFLLVALVASTAHADTVTARVVADDYYKVFVGDITGTSLTYVGGSGASIWNFQGAPFSFDLPAGQYIYVAAWDSASPGPPHMWIGEFVIGGTTLVSNTTDWVGTFDSSIKDPSTAQVQGLAQSAIWTTPAASMPNGSGPYGTLIGGSTASMIWYDVFSGGATQSGYALFRNASAAVAVPEPETCAMMLAGFGWLASVGRRRKPRKVATTRA